MKISIIIPTYNEAANIATLLDYLQGHTSTDECEIIVSDGGSNDNTLEKAREAGVIAVLSATKGRAAQMNYGAGLAKGDVFYFIHADCLPPPDFISEIQQAINAGSDLGRYRSKFDSGKTMLKFNALFTRFDLFVCMGGDQTLFITRSLFDRCSGFREDMKIMEEYDFCERARKLGSYKILKGTALISARKYETNSWLRVQWANAKIVSMYRKGASQDELVRKYKKMLNYRESAF